MHLASSLNRLLASILFLFHLGAHPTLLLPCSLFSNLVNHLDLSQRTGSLDAM